MPKVAKKIVLDGEEVNIPCGGDSSVLIPSGVIWPWYHTEDQAVPNGWALCDGTNGTPDLRGRFLLGASDEHAMGSTGGSEEVTLTVEQIPSHVHNYPGYGGEMTVGTSGETKKTRSASLSSKDTFQTGGSQPHPNMPPYFTIDYIMKL